MTDDAFQQAIRRVNAANQTIHKLEGDRLALRADRDALARRVRELEAALAEAEQLHHDHSAVAQQMIADLTDREQVALRENTRLRMACHSAIKAINDVADDQDDECGRRGCTCTYAGIAPCSGWLRDVVDKLRAALGGQAAAADSGSEEAQP